MKNAPDSEQSVRLDKWLWVARFFKTRSLATEAISRGKVTVNGSAARPSRRIFIDDELDIRKGPYQWTVTITHISDKRGPAATARELYSETDTSVQQRKLLSERLRLDRQSRPVQKGRPNKKDRRKLLQTKKQIGTEN